MKDLNDIVKRFRGVLAEAADTFGVEPHEVNKHRFNFVSARRVTEAEMMLLGGYGKIKAYVAPSPTNQDEESIKAMQKLLKSLNKGVA